MIRAWTSRLSVSGCLRSLRPTDKTTAASAGPRPTLDRGMAYIDEQYWSATTKL